MNTRPLTLDVAPWVLFRALASRERSFLIDAAQPWGEEWVSCMGFHPRMQLRTAAPGALATLDGLLADGAPPRHARARFRPLPFAGGAVVALAYELKNEIERLPQTQVEAPGAPHLIAAVYDAVVAYDHRRRRYHVASWHLDDAALARYADEVRAALADAAPARAAPRAPGGRATCSLDADAYAARVERILGYIAAGDVYQVNLSLRLETALAAAPLDLYERLRAAQPVPFGAFVDTGSETVLSNSPELLLRRRGDAVVTCPIKGTRPRGASLRADRALGRALAADPKERAEHVMIVDLERNDLGRLCRSGSVRVERLAELARFRTVQHLVSTVRGELRPGVATGDLLRATFPGGSITGAPKIRAMEIVDELERGPRGLYTGAIGWIDWSGDLDLNVAIRTAVAAGGRIAYHAGAGIVADSHPVREYAECLLKAEAFLAALGAHAPATHTAPAAGESAAL
jgi:para-aminobenzoate synthetase component 1